MFGNGLDELIRTLRSLQGEMSAIENELRSSNKILKSLQRRHNKSPLTEDEENERQDLLQRMFELRQRRNVLQKDLHKFEERFRFEHFEATRGKIRVISVNRRGAEIVVVIGRESYTRHVVRQGNHYYGHPIWEAGIGNLFLEYDWIGLDREEGQRAA